MAHRLLPAAAAAAAAAAASVGPPFLCRLQRRLPLLSFTCSSIPPRLTTSTRLYATGSSSSSSGSRTRRSVKVSARRRGSPPLSPLRRRRRGQRKECEVEVQIGIEEGLPDDPQILNIAENLRTDVGKAMEVAFDNLKKSDYRTRDDSITDPNKYEKVELSLLLCNDGFIQTLNKEWRDEDCATDVLSMSQHVPEFDLPVLLLGDIVISVDTAARQAVERGHTLIDEIRILVVHGLLHLLGFDHEISDEAEIEMEREEQNILSTLGWHGKGLITSVHNAKNKDDTQADYLIEPCQSIIKPHFPVYRGSKITTYMIYDIEGSHFDSNCQEIPDSAIAFKEAISKGVDVFMVTARSRSASMNIIKSLNLEGYDCASSSSLPGVFLQGALIYGRHGHEIFRANVDDNICKEAVLYSSKHNSPVVAFCQDQCYTFTEHPLVESLLDIHYEPKAELLSSIEQLLAFNSVQKLLFLNEEDKISSIVRPYWEEAVKGRAHVIQMQPNLIEIVPFGVSKRKGISILLNHLGISEDAVEFWDDKSDRKDILK